MYLEVDMEQEAAAKVTLRQEARASFEAFPEQKVIGEVVAIYPNNSRFVVKIKMTNLPKKALPGMTADVAILVNEARPALVVPGWVFSSGSEVQVVDTKGQKISLSPKFKVLPNGLAEILSPEIGEGDKIMVPPSGRP